MSRTPDDPRGETRPPSAPVVRFDDVNLGVGAPVSFSLQSGGLYVLTGPPGCGKSAALDLIGLSGRRPRGRIEMFGRDVARLKARDYPLLRRRVGRVFQDLRLDEALSAFDNVALAVRAGGVRAEDRRDQIAEVLGWLGLADRMGKRPGSLSPAERRRLALARAVINRPSLIIADEPTGDLTGKAAAEILRPLIDMHKNGAAVLVASRRADLLVGADAEVIALAPADGPRAEAAA